MRHNTDALPLYATAVGTWTRCVTVPMLYHYAIAVGTWTRCVTTPMLYHYATAVETWTRCFTTPGYSGLAARCAASLGYSGYFIRYAVGHKTPQWHSHKVLAKVDCRQLTIISVIRAISVNIQIHSFIEHRLKPYVIALQVMSCVGNFRYQ